MDALDDHYAECHAKRLRQIANKAIQTKTLEKDEIYELLKLLPLIVPERDHDEQKIESTESEEWNSPSDEKAAKYQEKIRTLRVALSNQLFLQNAVYQKDLLARNQPKSIAYDNPSEQSNQIQ